MLLQAAVYSYFFTGIALTNHTFPNVWLNDYPTFKTIGEGRWLADLIIWAQGGSGVQSLQMIGATTLQALNGILLAQVLGIHRRRTVALLASVLCLYPAFLDYYSFSIDHVTFVLGDTLVLLGARNFLQSRSIWGRAGGTSLLFLLAIAAYQPKVALVGFMGLGALLLHVLKPAEENYARPGACTSIFEAMGSMLLAVVMAVGLYWLTTRLLIKADFGFRTHLNTMSEAILEIRASYPKALAFFTKGSTGLPPWLKSLPGLGVAIGIASVLLKAWRTGLMAFVVTVAVLALMPFALRASFVINNQSWQDMGRILSAYGYCLVFFLGLGLGWKWLRGASVIVASVCLYHFAVLASQQSNAAALKGMYDTGSLTRIAARVELALGSAATVQRPLVVAGHYPNFDRSPYVRNFTGGTDANAFSPVFEVYRQTEILNFFLGRSVFRRPTKLELDRALRSIQGRAAWPATESVYLDDDILVIVLEAYRPGVPLTWTAD
jgi:hypothetical protein